MINHIVTNIELLGLSNIEKTSQKDVKGYDINY